jgi:uncharacterized 2Fe-2S/4Fe-4S cluster protein (DUF4445 family)
LRGDPSLICPEFPAFRFLLDAARELGNPAFRTACGGDTCGTERIIVRIQELDLMWRKEGE